MEEGVVAAGVGGLKFFPADPRQALRVRRYLLAAGTSLLVVAAFFLFHAFGLMTLDAAVTGAALIAAMVATFYGLLRTGLNLRFADPSLTSEQIAAAVLVLAYVSYLADDARNALSAFYMVALLFGALRLRTGRLLALAALALAAHSAAIYASYLRNPAQNFRPDLIQLALLAIVMPWTAFMGGYVNRLRSRLSDSHRQLQSAYDRIEQIAIRDELTGAYNRRFLMETLGRERSRSQRLATGFAVCLLDIDHFKSINDTLGHAAGDAVLSQFAARARTGLRDLDTLGRYGGEEFLVVLPLAEMQGAVNCAERIRASVEAAEIPQLPRGRRITVTAGVAAYRRGEEISALLARADEALYRGKAAGRNCVVALG